MKLGLGLVLIPRIYVQISDIEIKSLRYNRTGGDCPVGTVRCLLFAMTFEEDTSINYVDFFDGGVVDIIEEAVEEEIEVFPTSWPSIVIVVGSCSIVVVDIWFHFLQQFERFIFRLPVLERHFYKLQECSDSQVRSR